ncbi:MAG: Endopeptidase La, partial [Chloroflexi bacterium]|nr:Endopeptidase La [Chloroflexota bacterium]
DAAVRAYAAFVSNQVAACCLLTLAADAVARIIEFGVRLADDQGRLSTQFELVADLVRESDYQARADGAAQVSARHVEVAVAAQQRRVNLPEEELGRLIDDGTIEIDTQSRVVGQVNGLAVMDLGDYRFARPTRISARVGVGGEGLVDIEREVALSGPSHSKGVLTLIGYLIGQYADRRPISMSARLMFEQVHSPIDGDSASCAELCALLSALAQLPINQGIAMTGAINQNGRVQAVGGVTEKIEGHFAVCRAAGLTGNQGVIIPRSNVRHLMLKPDVVDAVKSGQFNVWSVSHVDDAIQILTGVPAGERQRNGSFSSQTVHGRVARRLSVFARAVEKRTSVPSLLRRQAASPPVATNPVGARTRMQVPRPGAESIPSEPPTAAARSFIAARPK